MVSSNTDLTRIAQSICDIKKLKLINYVNKGAFKQVFRVETIQGEPYALKIIRNNISSQRTDREVNAIQRCNHYNIARLFAVDTHSLDGNKYIFTLEEFLGGGTLTSRLQQKGYLSEEQIFNLGKQLIDAISHIATLGLVHRDIKPDNIMFRDEGNIPVIVDFGLVRDLSAVSLTQTWINCGPGTPYFAAPEQLNNQKHLIDWRTDQFSLGVTLCYAHFGVHPYQFPDESQFSNKTVERVATYGCRSNEVLNNFEKSNLKCLKKMTNIWPVERFRMPISLKQKWESEGET